MITEDMDCVYEYNMHLQPYEDAFRWVIFSLIILSLILCILCYKWRRLSNLIIYLECVIRTCSWFIPNQYNETLSSIDLTMLSIIYFFCFYCDKPN